MSYFRSPIRLFIVLLSVAVVFFILYGLGILKPVVGGVKYVLNPVERFFNSTGETVSGWFSFVGDISEMDEENTEMRQEIDQLRSENAKLKEIVHENELLRQEIGFQHEFSYDTTPAAVVSRSTDPALKVIQVNVGANQGISVDMPVIVGEGLLVGRISEVFPSSATILLMIDKQSSVNAVVQDTRASGIIHGEHGLDLQMELIPQNEDVQSGQSVVTSGLAGIYPSGLMIGTVAEVQESENALFKEARLNPAADFDHLEIVFVVTGAK